MCAREWYVAQSYDDAGRRLSDTFSFMTNALLDPHARSSQLPERRPRASPALTANHPQDMVCHMKTTLNIDDGVMVRLKREAARSGRTMSELVETALRRLLQTRPDAVDLPTLPTFDSGGALVDIADRDALYRAMEGR